MGDLLVLRNRSDAKKTNALHIYRSMCIKMGEVTKLVKVSLVGHSARMQEYI